MEVCCNNKLNILSCFVEFKKDFYIVPRNNLLKILKELKVYFELRAIAINLYLNVIAKLKNTKGDWKILIAI